MLLLWTAREFEHSRIVGLSIAKNRQGRGMGQLALEFTGDTQRWEQSSADLKPASPTKARSKLGFE